MAVSQARASGQGTEPDESPSAGRSVRSSAKSEYERSRTRARGWSHQGLVESRTIVMWRVSPAAHWEQSGRVPSAPGACDLPLIEYCAVGPNSAARRSTDRPAKAGGTVTVVSRVVPWSFQFANWMRESKSARTAAGSRGAARTSVETPIRVARVAAVSRATRLKVARSNGRARVLGVPGTSPATESELSA